MFTVRLLLKTFNKRLIEKLYYNVNMFENGVFFINVRLVIK